MSKRPSLTKQFPDADVVWRMQMWRNIHGTVFTSEGPMSIEVADLIMHVSCVDAGSGRKLTKKQRDAIAQCMEAFKSKKKAAKKKAAKKAEPKKRTKKKYKVATFWHPRDPKKFVRSEVHCYIRVYNVQWKGYVGFEVEAGNGDEAKHMATGLRLEHEQRRRSAK